MTKKQHTHNWGAPKWISFVPNTSVNGFTAWIIVECEDCGMYGSLITNPIY